MKPGRQRDGSFLVRVKDGWLRLPPGYEFMLRAWQHLGRKRIPCR
jgi:hypothetical protein